MYNAPMKLILQCGAVGGRESLVIGKKKKNCGILQNLKHESSRTIETQINGNNQTQGHIE